MTSRLRASWRIAVVGAAGAIALTGCAFSPEYAAYNLPPEQQTYTYEVNRHGVDTTWTFLSSEVTEDQTPEGYVCSEQVHAGFGGAGEVPPCRAEPLIYLRYEAGVDLHNAVPAPGPHRFTVHADRQAEHAPAIAGLRLWTSTDAGKTWRAAKVSEQGRGVDGRQDFTVMTVYPHPSRTVGYVSLKAESWDQQGNKVEQVVPKAFYLAAKNG